MAEKTEARVAGLRGAGNMGCWQEEGLKIWLRIGAFPQREMRDFLFVSRVTGTDLSLKPPTLGSGNDK